MYRREILATNGQVHDEAVEALAEAWPTLSRADRCRPDRLAIGPAA